MPQIAMNYYKSKLVGLASGAGRAGRVRRNAQDRNREKLKIAKKYSNHSNLYKFVAFVVHKINDQFKSRVTKKIYWAIVNENFPYDHGSLKNWMTRNNKQNKSKAHRNEVPNSKIAHLSFKRIYELDHYCVLEIKLKTGRHHQIRAQLSEIGFPIQGDLKYGAKRSNKDGSISLHARKLTIIHPVTKEILCFTADPIRVGIWKSVLFD